MYTYIYTLVCQIAVTRYNSLQNTPWMGGLVCVFCCVLTCIREFVHLWVLFAHAHVCAWQLLDKEKESWPIARGVEDILACKLSFEEGEEWDIASDKYVPFLRFMGCSQIAWFYNNKIAWYCSVTETESYESNKHRESTSISAFICTYARLHVYVYDYVWIYLYKYICMPHL